jgi:hypothetical protein
LQVLNLDIYTGDVRDTFRMLLELAMASAIFLTLFNEVKQMIDEVRDTGSLKGYFSRCISSLHLWP